jgi:hypothetical protein
MIMDAIPLGVFFVGTIVMMVVANEVGQRLGNFVRLRSEDEKESSVSAIVGTLLGLIAFILAFTFGIVTNRYDDRKALVREEANEIRTAYLRTDFMSEPDRSKTRQLFREYLDARIALAQSRDLDQMERFLTDSRRIQNQLWDMAVVNAFKDMNSDVAALYVDSLNNVINIHASRVAVGVQARVPFGIWLILYLLVILGMIGIGYQAAIAGSTRRLWIMPILAFSFALVIMLIASLDRPHASFITVSQQPLVDLRASMDRKVP